MFTAQRLGAVTSRCHHGPGWHWTDCRTACRTDGQPGQGQRSCREGLRAPALLGRALQSRGTARQLWAVQVGILVPQYPRAAVTPWCPPPGNPKHQCKLLTFRPEPQEPERTPEGIRAPAPPRPGDAHPPAAGRPRSPAAPAPPPSSAPSAPGRRACPRPAPGSSSGGS